ncbi:Uncharacterized protein FWK35_00011797 [Aphis craccivora]|uniref:MULE domain-containing protein n=1 Tax=Aphis craccivora TaxID=307492 RepID=A0A6G0ZA14_APHCR|nr:Uncharacterized protein FWK35_00011797 [Aphis craccivora]
MAIKTQSLLFKIDILHIDFEIGFIQATKEVFPDVKIKTCRFHIGQAWWHKINGNKKLRTAYNDQKNDLQLWLKSFFGLSFIAPDDVSLRNIYEKSCIQTSNTLEKKYRNFDVFRIDGLSFLLFLKGAPGGFINKYKSEELRVVLKQRVGT